MHDHGVNDRRRFYDRNIHRGRREAGWVAPSLAVELNKDISASSAVFPMRHV